MRRTVLLLACVMCLLVPVGMWAQDAPRAEVFGGYSYQRVDGGINLNGWNASLAGNYNKWLDLVADFSGQYGTFDSHSFLFGPQISYRGDERFTP